MGRRWTPRSEAGFRNDGVAGMAGVTWPAMVAAGHRARDARVRRGDARVFEDRHHVVIERRRRRAPSRIQWSASHKMA